MVQVVSCTTVVAVHILEVPKVVEGSDLFQGKLRDEKKKPPVTTEYLILKNGTHGCKMRYVEILEEIQVVCKFVDLF